MNFSYQILAVAVFLTFLVMGWINLAIVTSEEVRDGKWKDGEK